MARRLLSALDNMKLKRNGPTASEFTFQHRLCHDLESLIWVVVYAMMIHRKTILASADREECEQYKMALDECWAAHAYSSLLISHNHMIMTGTDFDDPTKTNSWFPDPREAAFFCDAMCMILRIQTERAPITYEGLCALFRKHINLANEPQTVDVVSK